jgi:hypothetical protein
MKAATDPLTAPGLSRGATIQIQKSGTKADQHCAD